MQKIGHTVKTWNKFTWGTPLTGLGFVESSNNNKIFKKNAKWQCRPEEGSTWYGEHVQLCSSCENHALHFYGNWACDAVAGRRSWAVLNFCVLVAATTGDTRTVRQHRDRSQGCRRSLVAAFWVLWIGLYTLVEQQSYWEKTPLEPGGQKAQTGHAEAGTQLGVNYGVQCLTSLEYMMPAA